MHMSIRCCFKLAMTIAYVIITTVRLMIVMNRSKNVLEIIETETNIAPNKISDASFFLSLFLLLLTIIGQFA